jgi:hypothetical protein
MNWRGGVLSMTLGRAELDLSDWQQGRLDWRSGEVGKGNGCRRRGDDI